MGGRPWVVGVLLAALAVAAAGCAADAASGSDRQAEELARVKADRDHLAALVAQLSSSSETLEAYAVNDRRRCLATLKAVRRRIAAARADLGAGPAAGLAATERLDAAARDLDRALAGDCAPLPPVAP